MNHMDYILHPIPLSDINRPIYYMVRSFFLHLVGGLPHDDLYEEWEGVKVEATFGDYLVFPSADFPGCCIEKFYPVFLPIYLQ